MSNRQQTAGTGRGRPAIMPTRRPLSVLDTDLVYETNKWTRYLWDDVATSDARRLEEEGLTRFPRWHAFQRETFTRLFQEEPQRTEETPGGCEWAEVAHDLCGDLPEFSRLRDRCMSDKLWAGMAATALCEEVYETMPEPGEAMEDCASLARTVRGLEQLAESGLDVEKNVQEARQNHQDALQAAQDYAGGLNHSGMRQALRRGIEAAQEAIDEAEAAVGSYGWGMGTGSGGHGAPAEEKRKLIDRVKNSNKLQRLAKMAGRMRRIAAQKQRSKVSHGRDEVSDIVTGDDLARLVPTELAKLATDETRMLFYKGLLERNLMCYELKGREPVGQGPVICCLDNSGSMAGDNEMWGKAVALALLDIAVRQKRSFALFHFDGQVTARLVVKRGTTPDAGLVLDAMEHFSGGGTDFWPPLRESLELIEDSEFEKADVILVTDGYAPTTFVEEYRRRAKEKDVRTYSVHVGNDAYGDPLTVLGEFSDEVIKLDDIRSDDEATDAVFSI